MYIRVRDLKPGMKVELDGGEAICIGTIPVHPLYPHLWMVIWWVLSTPVRNNGAPFWSHDALDALQVVGKPVYPDTDWCREQRLRMVLHNDTEAARRVMNMESAGD